MRFALLLITAALVALATIVSAQDVPNPKAFFGYELGERYTHHADVVRYVDALAETSDRIHVERYGKTNQGRELVLAFATSSGNQAQLETLRTTMAKIADPRTMAEGETAEALIADLPVFVWLSYCVHGNETSCTEAGLRVLHELATSDSDEVQKILDGALVIIDPCVNPDGRDRYVNWFNAISNRRGDPNPQSMEHREPWPGGRQNHYGFDLNRDWAFVSQVETRSRLERFVQWNPQVHGDFHEMGAESSYFFFPADIPVNSNVDPSILKWGETFGRGNAKAFDKRGWRYYTAEQFDLFYPGYGDSWPSFTGAIGMTYEQAGHSSSGSIYRRRDGKLLTLKDRVDHHFVASMATIDTAVQNRLPLLRDYARFRASAIEEGKGGAIREFILEPGVDAERSARLVEILIAQGIEVRRADEEFTVAAANDYQGRRAEKKFAAGTYLVSLAQPTKRLAKTLLEPKTEIRELYFYDVAAWSLPLAFGVKAYWSARSIDVKSALLDEAPQQTGSVREGDSTYGFLLSWDRTSSLRASLRLMERGVEVRSATKPLTLAGKKWDRGTVFVPRGQKIEKFDEIIADVAESTGAEFWPVATGMSEKGIDLGSDRVRTLKSPRVALIGGKGVSETSFGATRFLLEKLYDVPYSIFDIDDLASLKLDDYSAVVFPNAFARLDDGDVKKLREFGRSGGVIVAWGSMARALGAEGKKLVSISMKSSEKKADPATKPLKIEEKEERRRKQSAPGSIFLVELDPAHPLSFGYGSELEVFKSGTSTFDPMAGGTPVAIFRDAPPLSGYLSEEGDRKMRGRGYAMVAGLGRGSVVLFAEDPNFRSAWHGLTRLFLNAVLLLPRE